VWFIDLATVDDPLVVGATLATTLGVSDVAGQKILDRLVGRLSGEETLLILDNSEHLVEAAASLTSERRQRTESLVMVATSREPLGITGEATYPVPTWPKPTIRSSPPRVRRYGCLSIERRWPGPGFTCPLPMLPWWHRSVAASTGCPLPLSWRRLASVCSHRISCWSGSMTASRFWLAVPGIGSLASRR
jgi:hypothetical protein